MTKETIKVTGMSCAHCEAHVTMALQALPGVKSCKVSAKKGEAVVKFDETAVGLDAIRGAIVDAGYKA